MRATALGGRRGHSTPDLLSKRALWEASVAGYVG